MHPRSLIWFDMVDEQYKYELWYANFRVTKRTFEFILDKTQQEICRKSTPMSESVIANRCLAITLDYLSPRIIYELDSSHHYFPLVLLLFFQDEYACVINFIGSRAFSLAGRDYL